MSTSINSLIADQEVVENGYQHVELLSASNDDHGGVIVDMMEPMDPNVFVTLLRASMTQWRLQGKKGIWIKLPIELVNLIETVVKEGFRYHHAEPNYLMLIYWIPETANTIPANASHIVRIGAVITNEKRQVLVVQEKIGKLQGTGFWKIPTGILEEGEDIFEGAAREVKEETGIDAEFVEILAFRQSHKSFFEKSELFFLCMMRPLSFDIQKQDLEIEAAQWMPFEEYAAQPYVKKYNSLKYMMDIWLAKVDGNYAGFSPKPATQSFNDGSSYLYLNRRDGSPCGAKCGVQNNKMKDPNHEDVSGYGLPSPTGCMNHTVCPYPCHPLPPTLPSPQSGCPSCRTPPPSLPPVSGYPSYGAPPPPPPVSGYPSYGAPPPPVFGYPSYREPPSPPVSGNPSYGAPPPPFQGNSPPVPCCQYPSPRPFDYVTYDKNSDSSPLYPSLFPVMIILFSRAVLLFFPGDLI